ncbi:hypothetical protein EV426DRAFT_707947 [Tirmania nivea]|nr:hypothetical protein EV426DRAFT_707947 [Tirmania nivea]
MPHYTAVPIEYSTSSTRPPGAGRITSRAYSRGHHCGDSGYRSHYEAENNELPEREERHAHRSRHHRTSGLYYGRQSPENPVDNRYSYELEYSPAVFTTAPEVTYTYPEGISVPAPYPAHALGAESAPKITVSACEYEAYEYTSHPQQPDSHNQHHQIRYPEHDHSEENPRRSVPQDSYSGRHVYPSESSHDPYRSNHSYSGQLYSHHNHPQSPTASSYHLRRIPSSVSNHSERSLASPPSPTDSETSREVNSYGRVPLWYEERVAFTRYT